MTYEPQRWTLEGLLPEIGSDAYEDYVADINRRLDAFEAVREDLAGDMDESDFVHILERYEDLHAEMARLVAYSYLWFSEDTSDQEALTFRAQIREFVADADNRTLFFSLWWKSLDAEAAERLMAVSGDLRYFLESLRRFKPYTLSELVEQTINVKDTNGIGAVLTIYDMITTGFTYHLTVEGEEKELTRGELLSYVFSPRPELREAAYQELYRIFGQNADVLAQIYMARVRDWYQENVKLRGHPQPISVRNLDNDIPDEVVDTLLEVIRENIGLFQRYFRFKAQQLDVDCLRRYDIYAPLVDIETEYSFDEAVRMVDDAYRSFSPALADAAMSILKARHLDAEVRARKMGGAYCYSVLPGLEPWVLVNFTGKINDVSTLAHELGHGVHGLMAAEHSPLTFHSALPMAETASVFGEMLLIDKLLGEESDEVRRSLLNSFMADAYATIVRQAYFVLFEKQAHRMIREGTTSDKLQEAYLNNLREQFGDAVEISDDFRLEWLAIPHIYKTPFYCYAYAFGNLLVLSFYRKYKEIGLEDFVPQYLRILSYGGSASPEHIIGEAGFDMASPEFWRGGFEVLEEMLDELEALS